jgi:hypothetical protein
MRRLSLLGVGLMLLSAWSPAKEEVGLKVGDGTPAYNPLHVSGQFKGTNACPV